MFQYCQKDKQNCYSALGQSVYCVWGFFPKLEVKLIIAAIRSYGSRNFITPIMCCENAIRE